MLQGAGSLTYHSIITGKLLQCNHFLIAISEVPQRIWWLISNIMQMVDIWCWARLFSQHQTVLFMAAQWTMNHVIIVASTVLWIHVFALSMRVLPSALNSSPKNENSVINYSPSCLSKPVRPSFIFRTQIKIFLMKSESFLTLNRQQRNYHVQGPKRSKDIVKIVHMWYNHNFMKLWEYFLHCGTVVNKHRILTWKRKNCWIKSLFLFSFCTKSIKITVEPLMSRGLF